MNLSRHSQYGEEDIIKNYLGNINEGTYVDIGAGSAIEISNTYALYENGWKGVLVEPFSIYHKEIAEKRPKDKLCTKVICNRIGTVVMLDTGSTDTIIGQSYRDGTAPHADGSPFSEFTAECYTMKEFLEEYPEVKNCDFASIDIETGEEMLFSCTDFNVFTPKLMCVEYQMRHVDYRPKWEHYLTPFYEPKELIGGNAFYIRK